MRGRRIAAVTAVLVFASALAAPGTGTALPAPNPEAGPVIVAGPGSTPTTFYTLIAVAVPGAPLTFVNADYEPHDVITEETGPTDQPWCFLYPESPCPLLWSELIGIGTTPVLGTENLEAGEQYEFYCSIHPGMRGILFAVGG